MTLRDPGDGFLARTATDSTGTFEFVFPRRGGVRLHGRGGGYRAATTPTLTFGEDAFFAVEFRLDPEVILLAPLEVVARGRREGSPVLNGFRDRVALGLGSFILREEIERRRPVYATDLLRSVPGVELISEGTGSRPRIRLARAAGRGCDARIFLDGVLMNRTGSPPIHLDDLVSPGSIEGIEIYRGLGSIPAEYLNPDTECGVVGVWTRRGRR